MKRAVVLGLVFVVCFAATGHADAKLAFRDDTARTFDWADVTAGQELAVCNTGTTGLNAVRVAFEGFDFEVDDERADPSDILAPPMVSSSLAPGVCSSVPLEAAGSTKPDPAIYEGLVVVTAAGAGPIGLEVTIDVDSTPEWWTAFVKKVSDLSARTQTLGNAWLGALAWLGIVVVSLLLVLRVIAPVGGWGLKTALGWGVHLPSGGDNTAILYLRMIWWYVLRGWQRLFGTTVQVEDFTPDKDDATTLTGAVRAALLTTPTRSGSVVDHVTGPPGSGQLLSDLADTVKDLPEGKFVAPLLKFARYFLPQRLHVIKGTLLGASKEHGVGIALSLVKPGNHVVASAEIWQKMFDPALTFKDEEKTTSYEARHLLALAGASWVEHQLTPDGLRHPLLGTSSWRSYALTRVADHLDDAEPRDLERLLAEAVDEDPDNHVAAHALAFNDARLGEDEQAEERLGKLYDRYVPKAQDARPEHFLAYPIGYNYVVVRLNRAAVSGYSNDDRKTIAGELVPLTRRLVGFAMDEADKLHRVRLPAVTEALQERRDMVRRFEGPTLGLLAGLLAIGAPKCAKAAKPPSRDGLREKIADGSVTHCEIVAYLDSCSHLSYRTRYNLACYFSELAAQPVHKDKKTLTDRALSELREAFEVGRDLVARSAKDQSLTYLRKHRKADFDKLHDDFTKGSPLPS